VGAADGGYLITIESVDATGKLNATYANAGPLPFAKAEATRDGKTSGSTCTLYDPLSDILKGVYFQAVVQPKFDVFFHPSDNDSPQLGALTRTLRWPRTLSSSVAGRLFLGVRGARSLGRLLDYRARSAVDVLQLCNKL
jgi:hypothetical protein